MNLNIGYFFLIKDTLYLIFQIMTSSFFLICSLPWGYLISLLLRLPSAITCFIQSQKICNYVKEMFPSVTVTFLALLFIALLQHFFTLYNEHCFAFLLIFLGEYFKSFTESFSLHNYTFYFLNSILSKPIVFTCHTFLQCLSQCTPKYENATYSVDLQNLLKNKI